MQTEDALDFRNGLRQVEGTVRARDDELGLRAVEVRALIQDDAIGAIRRIALATVAGDGVMRGVNRSRIERVQKRRFRRPHACWAGKRSLSFPPITATLGWRISPCN
jgi:hypothetical protein